MSAKIGTRSRGTPPAKRWRGAGTSTLFGTIRRCGRSAMIPTHELVAEAKLSENPEQRLAELRQRLGDKIIDDQVSGIVGDPDDDKGDDE